MRKEGRMEGRRKERREEGRKWQTIKASPSHIFSVYLFKACLLKFK